MVGPLGGVGRAVGVAGQGARLAGLGRRSGAGDAGRTARRRRPDRRKRRATGRVGRDLAATVDQLISAGIPAATLTNPRNLLTNPHLAARGYLEEVASDVVGTHAVPAMPLRMSGVDRWIRQAAPLVGEHNDEVLGGLLGLGAERARAAHRGWRHRHGAAVALRLTPGPGCRVVRRGGSANGPRSHLDAHAWVTKAVAPSPGTDGLPVARCSGAAIARSGYGTAPGMPLPSSWWALRSVLGARRRVKAGTMPPVCALCLDSRRCWTCEGAGWVEVAADVRRVCTRCAGSGICPSCAPDQRESRPLSARRATEPPAAAGPLPFQPD